MILNLFWPHTHLRLGYISTEVEWLGALETTPRLITYPNSQYGTHNLETRLDLDSSLCITLLASFPGSPRTQTKNRKERGEPGKIYHVRNVIGRESLITCGRMNELAHAVWTEYIRSVAIALWLTEWD